MSVPDFHALSLDQLRAFDAAFGLAIRQHPDFPRKPRKDQDMTRHSKSDLVDAVASSMTPSYSKAEAGRLFDRFLAAISQMTDRGDSVAIKGFGTFEARTRAARVGRHPGTGAAVDIPASTTLHFKASKPKKAGA